MEVVDICTPAFPNRNSSPELVSREIRTTVAMGVGRVKGMEPTPRAAIPVNQNALVVGGGIGGMSAALAIADHGFEVNLVEKEDELGGNVRALHRTLEGESPQELLE
jgi:heterodisulfide reductase subunit A